MWYTPRNSIIVDATADAVAAGVQQALQNLRSGEFATEQIRQAAVELAECFRAQLVSKVLLTCEQHCDHWQGSNPEMLQQHLSTSFSKRHKLGLL